MSQEGTGAALPHITIGDKSHAVLVPKDFATRDELLDAWAPLARKGDRVIVRVCAALIGACTRIGRYAEQDKVPTYEGCDCNVMRYGGAVYTWLIAHGATVEDIVRAGGEVAVVLHASRAPREAEVKAQADFTGPPEA